MEASEAWLEEADLPLITIGDALDDVSFLQRYSPRRSAEARARHVAAVVDRIRSD